MTKIQTYVTGIILVSTCFSASADQLAEVQARGTLVCGVLGTFEPFGYTDPGSRNVVGYDVDMCIALAKAIGVKAEVKPVSVEARIPELQQGHMDVLVAGLGYSAARAEQVDYSKGYYISEHKLMVKSAKSFSAPSDLAGKRVSFTKGGITEAFVRGAVPAAQLTGYEDTTTAFTALVQNKVAGFSAPEVVEKRLISKMEGKSSDFQVLEPAVGQEYWGIGVRKNEGALLAAVNKGLDELENNGEAQKVFETWLGAGTVYNLKRPFNIAPIPR